MMLKDKNGRLYTWRQAAAQTVHNVIKANPDADLPTLRKLIFAAYPFGDRAHSPYKIWLEEVRKGLLPFLPVGERNESSVGGCSLPSEKARRAVVREAAQSIEGVGVLPGMEG